MDVDEPSSAATIDASAETRKISTSGWKGSRNEEWKQKKASKVQTKKKQGSKSLVFNVKNKKKLARK